MAALGSYWKLTGSARAALGWWAATRPAAKCELKTATVAIEACPQNAADRTWQRRRALIDASEINPDTESHSVEPVKVHNLDLAMARRTGWLGKDACVGNTCALTLALTGPPPQTTHRKEAASTAGPVERGVRPHCCVLRRSGELGPASKAGQLESRTRRRRVSMPSSRPANRVRASTADSAPKIAPPGARCSRRSLSQARGRRKQAAQPGQISVNRASDLFATASKSANTRSGPRTGDPRHASSTEQMADCLRHVFRVRLEHIEDCYPSSARLGGHARSNARVNRPAATDASPGKKPLPGGSG